MRNILKFPDVNFIQGLSLLFQLFVKFDCFLLHHLVCHVGSSNQAKILSFGDTKMSILGIKS